MIIHQLPIKCFALFLVLLATVSCKKEEHRPPKSTGSSCRLIAMQTDIFAAANMDSFYYVNGKIDHVISWYDGLPVNTIQYVYFGRDSLHILEANQLKSGYYFDRQQRLIKEIEYPSGSTTEITYNARGDSIYFTYNGTMGEVGFRNPLGNLTYLRAVDGETLYEVHISYDNSPHVFKGLYHIDNLEQSLSKNNPRRMVGYANGIQIETYNFEMTYTNSGQVSRLNAYNNLIQYDFAYSCP